MWPLQLDPSAPIRRPSSNFFFVVPFRRQLSLVIDNLPTLSGQFQCAFSALGKVLLTNATRTANGVICTTPRTDHIPANPPGQRKWLLFRILSGSDERPSILGFELCPTGGTLRRLSTSPVGRIGSRDSKTTESLSSSADVAP